MISRFLIKRWANLDFAIKTARENPQIKSTEKLREQFIKKATDEGVIKTSGIYVPDNIDEEFPLEAFETIQEVVKKRTKRISNYTLY
jgi:hypothetical protein